MMEISEEKYLQREILEDIQSERDTWKCKNNYKTTSWNINKNEKITGRMKEKPTECRGLF